MTTRTYATQANAPAGVTRRACRQFRLVPGRVGPVVADFRYDHGDQARPTPTDPGVPP